MTSDSRPEPSLESRYRRWLRAYPAEHRRRYADELLGVLLASAEPGRRRPSPQDVADLVRGGLRVRARRELAHYNRQEWRDALTVVSLLAPLVLLAGMIRYATQAVSFFVGFVTIDHGAYKPDWATTFFTAPGWLAGGATAVFALCGLRRTAAGCAFATTALGLAASIWSALALGASGFPSDGFLMVMLLGLVSGVSLLASSGPHRGRELLGGKAPLVLVITAAVVLGLSASRHVVWDVLDAPAWWVTEASVWVVPALGAAFLLRTPAGRRACALLSAALVPIVATVLLGDAIMAPTMRVAFSLVVLPLTVLALAGAASYTVRKIGDNAVQRATERGRSD